MTRQLIAVVIACATFMGLFYVPFWMWDALDLDGLGLSNRQTSFILLGCLSTWMVIAHQLHWVAGKIGGFHD